MHALVVRLIIHDADRTREVLDSQVVPQVSGAPGFKTGYWTWSTGSGALNGLSMTIFDSEENARAAGDRISAIAADAPDNVTLDGVEVREVVARPELQLTPVRCGCSEWTASSIVAWRSPTLGKARGHGRDREVLRRDLGELVPRDPEHLPPER